MNLYELTDEFRKLLWLIEQNESEDDSDIENALDSLALSIDDKLENCCAYYKNLTAEADMYGAEIKRLQAEKKYLENKAERFKQYVGRSIGEGEKWGRGVHKIGWRKSEAVEMEEGASIPECYQRIKIEPDKTAIKKDLKEGADIPGFRLAEKQNIQIK